MRFTEPLKMIVIFAALGLTACIDRPPADEHRAASPLLRIHCARASDLFDIADRCSSGRDQRACAALKQTPQRCIECRKLQMMEQNDAVRDWSGECKGVYP